MEGVEISFFLYWLAEGALCLSNSVIILVGFEHVLQNATFIQGCIGGGEGYGGSGLIEFIFF